VREERVRRVAPPVGGVRADIGVELVQPLVELVRDVRATLRHLTEPGEVDAPQLVVRLDDVGLEVQ
jgi:hypothetical protein